MKLSNVTLITVVLGLIMGLSSSAFAQGSKRVSIKPVVKYRDWSVYRHPVGNDVICFAASAPKDMIPKDVKRLEVLFYVTRWKSNPSKAQVSMLIGYPFKVGSKPEVQIKSQKFKFFVKGDKAWVREEGDEVLLLKSMRRGSLMKVTGVSAQGILTTDKYSLSGITKALNRIKRLCR